MILTSSLFGVFSRGSLVKEAAATSGKVRDEFLVLSTANKEDFGVVTQSVIAERKQHSFFCRGGFFS